MCDMPCRPCNMCCRTWKMRTPEPIIHIAHLMKVCYPWSLYVEAQRAPYPIIPMHTGLWTICHTPLPRGLDQGRGTSAPRTAQAHTAMVMSAWRRRLTFSRRLDRRGGTGRGLLHEVRAKATHFQVNLRRLLALAAFVVLVKELRSRRITETPRASAPEHVPCVTREPNPRPIATTCAWLSDMETMAPSAFGSSAYTGHAQLTAQRYRGGGGGQPGLLRLTPPPTSENSSSRKK